MRDILFFYCLLAIGSFPVCATVVGHYDVNYQDKLGIHVIDGKKLDNISFAYNSTADKQLKLATLDWPPYISKDICRQGWVLQSTIALLHHVNYGAVVTFYPWARALNVVESGKADILFPEYLIEPQAPSDVFSGTLRLDHLTLSEAFGLGPVAFIKRRNYDLTHYTDLNSLVNEHIGVVRGYQNTPEFDSMMDKGSFKIVQARDDRHNLMLLLNNRVNLIVGDPQVIMADVKSSGQSTAEKKVILDKISVVEPLISMNGLFYAVSKQSQYGKTLVVDLNRAINVFKKQGIFGRIKYKVTKSCDNDF